MQLAEVARDTLVRKRSHLLRQSETEVGESALRWIDLQMERISRSRSRQWHGDRYPEHRVVQLVDRDNDEGSRLGLFGATRGIGVGPNHVALCNRCAQ